MQGNKVKLNDNFKDANATGMSTVSMEGGDSIGNSMNSLNSQMASMSLDDVKKTIIHVSSSGGNSMKDDEEEKKMEFAEDHQFFGENELGFEIKLNDLKFKRNLGAGASGYVELRLHKPTKKKIALKIIPLQTKEVVKKQIYLEIKTLHECESDNVVACYGAFYKGGFIYIALEYLDAGSLADILKEVGRIPEQVLGLMTIQMLKGMDYLHRKKVIHRDIKPSNILLDRTGRIKIADFGVSGKLEQTMGCLSSWVGTVTHMSPERLRGESYYPDTDIWSLGLVVLECALG